MNVCMYIHMYLIAETTAEISRYIKELSAFPYISNEGITINLNFFSSPRQK